MGKKIQKRGAKFKSYGGEKTLRRTKQLGESGLALKSWESRWEGRKIADRRKLKNEEIKSKWGGYEQKPKQVGGSKLTTRKKMLLSRKIVRRGKKKLNY